MRKFTAVLLSIIMTLSVIVAMPVFAEETEPVNLVVNGDFEADTAGADGYGAEGNVTEITGWTQMESDNSFVLVAREEDNNWVKGYNDSNGAYSGSALSGAGISQVITIDTEKPWYTDYKNYKYELKYDAHKAGSVWRGYVYVVVIGANGRTEKTDITPVATEYVSNAYNADITIDLSAAVKKIGKQPVKSIEIQLTSSGRWEYQTYDNIRLTPIYSLVEEVENLFADGSFEELAQAEISAWGFAAGATKENNLINDTDGFDGDYYIAVDAGQRVEQQAATEIIQPKKAYLIELYYTSVESTAFVSIESPGAGYLKLTEQTLPATGTTWDNAKWQSFQHVVVMRECDNKGLLIRLRNSASATNAVYYDCVTVSEIHGYDTTNLIANGDFEYGDGSSIANWIQNGSVSTSISSNYVNTGSSAAQTKDGYGALQQWVYVDPKYGEADFDLSFYFNYSAGGGGMPSILVRAYREDGPFTGYSYTACVDMNSNGILSTEDGDRGCVPENQAYVDGLHWTVRNNKFYGTISLDKALSKDTDERPVKKFLIQLQSANLGGTYDSVRLVPRETNITFVNKDNNIAAAINEIKDDKLFVRASYRGEAEIARAYVTVYSVINDELQLEKVIVKSLGDGEVTVDLSKLGLEAGKNVVSTFIWDGTQAPVISKTLN
ncbi:MAG: hypothetical protein IKV89_03575 [Clostridia bacterium]|nr:hypothetical protein [Clostridia bacterium]